MSMIAKFVQVAPALLSDLLEDPERVSNLFQEEIVPRRGPIPMPNEARERALRSSPQLLAASIARLDPRLREQLTQSLGRLGIDPQELERGEGGEKLVQVMQRARGILAAAQAPASPALKGKGADLSLDKAWHGLHYLLCGQVEPGSTLLSQAVLGGTEIGEDDSGYGPARVFSVAQVADIARELSRSSLETEMRTRFDSARMNGLGIYPQGWDQAGALDWVLDEFRNLRKFYTEASAGGLAIVTCLE